MNRLLALPLLLCAACTTVESVNLVPSRVAVARQHAGTLHVEAQGTDRSWGVGPRRVSAEDLAQAVTAAVLESELFAAVGPLAGADWRLSVSIAELTDPEAGLDMEVVATLRWRLTDATGTTVRWEAPITTEAIARPDDALDFGDRERIATERALAENLRQGIERLGELEL